MGRFLLGFIAGTAIGAAVVVLTNPRSSGATRESLSDRFHNALDAYRQASGTRQQSMWADYRSRGPTPPTPLPPPPASLPQPTVTPPIEP